MKMFFASALLFSNLAFAGDIKCVIQEISDDKASLQEYLIAETNDPHGALMNYKTQLFEGYTGFVALSDGFIVIHLYNVDSNAAISVAGTGEGKKYSRLQYLLPGSGLNQAIIVECLEQ